MPRCIGLVGVAIVVTSCSHSGPGRSVAALPAPALTSPIEGAIMSFFPRDVDFQWTAVAGAARYAIEVDCYHCCQSDQWCSDVRGTGHVTADLRDTTHTEQFPGDQPGRWRVWAIDSRGRGGLKSEWRQFVFNTRPAGGVPPSSAGFRDPQTGASISGPGVVMPKATYAPNARYTAAAIRDRVQGNVMLTVVVGVDGRVTRAAVAQSLRPDLDARALDTIKTWRFDPARRDGQAVAAEIQIAMSFHVQ